MRVILDLCGGTGAWSEPYREAGYDVRLVTLPAQDVREYEPPAEVYGVLAAPPCTEFAVSGARWWASKEPGRLAEALEIVTACLRIVERTRPWFWALENPYDYGDPWLKRTCVWGNHNRPTAAPITRPQTTGGRWRVSLTNHLYPRPTGAQLARLVSTGILPADWVHRLGQSVDRSALRSITPPGFARAFFEANP